MPDNATRLKDRLAQATLALRYETAAQRILLAARRLRDELRYNPNWELQPRLLTGPGAGQWTDGGSVGSEPVQVAAKKPDIKFIEYLLRKHGILDRETRRRIHDEITKRGMSRKEIEDQILDFVNDT